jgi:hypothetical protein
MYDVTIDSGFTLHFLLHIFNRNGMVLYRSKSPKMTEVFSAWDFDPATWPELARMRPG